MIYIENMPTITIPKNLIKMTIWWFLPRKEYERLLIARLIPEFQPTTAEKKILQELEKNRAQGSFFNLNELKHKLGLQVDPVVYKFLRKYFAKMPNVF